MYPVNSTFHNLSTQDAPKTRVRVYFIGEGVDCTDDAAVQTNGTLLVGAVGDTDSNGRIGQDGITFTEMFNPDKNIQIGTAVSYQIGMTLLNTDGALNGFSYGRCKVYLDVYDAANSAWRVCPMGVFVIDIPTKRRVQLVTATGYDQMQLLDTICDSWWSGLNWSGGITLSALLTSMANQLGVKVSTATASAILNSSVSYTEAPFACVEVTYREVLEYIAEATGTIARFDRDGYLDLRFFSAAKIGGNTVTINADTVGNTCLDIDIAEYQAAAIDLLKVKIAEDDIGVAVGSGTNQYTIVNNLFLYGSTATIITNRATPIYNRLNGLGAYTPIQAKLIYDWSLEAGDIINIVRDSTTYPVLIFQQTLAWRGGYVTADILADGDNVRPVMDYDERASYRMASEISQKVGDNEIISKINQTAESIQIQASRVDLAGYVTFTNLSTSGQTTIDGGNITTGTIDASVVTVDNINASNITSGTMSASKISGGTLTLGGANNTDGTMTVLDANGVTAATVTNAGITVNGSQTIVGDNYPTTLVIADGGIVSQTNGENSLKVGRNSLGGGYILIYKQINGVVGTINNAGITFFDGTKAKIRYDYNGFIIRYDNGYGVTDSPAVELFHHSSAGSRITFATPPGDSGYPTTIGSAGSTFGANATFSANATVNGVLDVTNRRTNAVSLSALGWYRAICVNRDSNAINSFSIDITIGKTYAASSNEIHTITLLAVNNNFSFVNEASSGNAFDVQGIRYTRVTGGAGYVDIKYSTSNANDLYVDFNVRCKPGNEAYFIPQSLQSVADSPSDETIRAQYTFSKSTNGDYTFSNVFGKTWYFRKRNGVVYVDAPDAMTPTTNGLNTIGTLPDEFKPKYIVRLPVANNSGKDKWLYISTTGAVTAFCYTNAGTSTPFSVTASYLAMN